MEERGGSFSERVTGVPVCAGINLLQGAESIHLTRDDFDLFTDNGGLLDEEGEFGREQFQDMSVPLCISLCACFIVVHRHVQHTRALCRGAISLHTPSPSSIPSLCALDRDSLIRLCGSRMRGELWRFSRRELVNVLAFSDSDEFKSTVVMYEMSLLLQLKSRMVGKWWLWLWRR